MKKSAMVLAGCMMATALGAKPVYVNDTATAKPRMEVVFLKQPQSDNKSDAALLVTYAPEGVEVFLVDGGMPNCTALKALLDLRRSLLIQMGKRDEEKNPDYKLRFTSLVTHCHPDHIGELVSNVLRNPFFELEDLYLPEATALPTGGNYLDSHNSDVNERIALLRQIRQFQKRADIHTVPFATREEISCEGGRIELYGPVTDWGKGEALQYLIGTYYAQASPEKRKNDVPTAVINSNCVWYRFVFQGKSILFTGDVMKKARRNDEPFDRMLDFYGPQSLRSDIVKYPHHGILRNPAAPRLVEDLLHDPERSFVIVTAMTAWRESVPALEPYHVQVRDASKKDVRFSISDSELIELP
ncbi:MAG: hypothetical protein MR519_05920 [Spirochaetaceae bacterium]|nr:hypothetical protein [Spirochaetaceae bacterium]